MLRREFIRSTERSFAAPVVLADVLLDFYAELFLANPGLRASGLEFERFALAPWRYLAAGLARVSNGQQIERMRHHRFPRRPDLPQREARR